MKKLLTFCLMAITLLIVGTTLTSCSDDDNGGGNASVSVNIGGQKTNFSYVYWNIDNSATTSSSKRNYQIEFYSFDPYKGSFPKIFSTFLVGFEANGSETELPIGTFSSYTLSGALNLSQSTPEGTYFERDITKSGKLVISKENGVYHISIAPLYILSGEDESNLQTTQTALDFSANIPKAPKDLWE